MSESTASDFDGFDIPRLDMTTQTLFAINVMRYLAKINKLEVRPYAV